MMTELALDKNNSRSSTADAWMARDGNLMKNLMMLFANDERRPIA